MENKINVYNKEKSGSQIIIIWKYLSISTKLTQ